MSRFSWVCVVLAACTDPAQTQPVRETLGSQTHITIEEKAKIAQSKPDPARDKRMAYADPGGMWMPQQMTLPQHVQAFKDMGVEIDAKKLADPLASPLAAVVSLGGCTASFVSPDGLIVTNHHCVQGALNYASDDKHNYVEDGFLAKTPADEVSAGPSQHVMVAQAFTDVTKQVRDGLEKIKDPVARKEELERRTKALVADCEHDRPWARCQVSNYFRGGQYILIDMLDLKDVRLVYVPARSVGDYGGEIDNWEWPRHTGDWSFYRAYIGPDGRPAEYSKNNVPFHPKHFLKVESKPLANGDFVMVAGYPGATTRTQTASAIHHALDVSWPKRVEYAKQQYAIMEAHWKDGGDLGRKAGVKKQGIQNGLEKYEGILQGFAKNPALIAQKDELDAKAKAWAGQAGREDYKQAIDRLEAIQAEEWKTEAVDMERGIAFGGSALLGEALSLTRWAEERTKEDSERKPGYQERDMDRAKARVKSFKKGYDRTLDRLTFKLALTRALALPEADRPWLAALLDAKKGQKIDDAFIEKTLDAWYAKPALEDDKARLDLLEKGTTKELKASKDPWIAAAQRIWPTVKSEERRSDARTGELALVTPKYVEAMKEAVGGALAPDANGTLRISYGTVRSLHPASKLDDSNVADWPFTVASQILKKNTGEEPFNAPKKVLDAIKAKKFGSYADPALGGELPINFESDLDITGGNSGSPVLNDKGELVGLAFDGNKEGLASDAVFDGATTRTIQVDVRYMLWTMDLLDDAKHLLREMGVMPKM